MCKLFCGERSFLENGGGGNRSVSFILSDLTHSQVVKFQQEMDLAYLINVEPKEK